MPALPSPDLIPFGLFLLSFALFQAARLSVAASHGPAIPAPWDAAWYGSIVLQGYATSGTGQANVAFFPGFPILVACARALVRNGEIANLLVTGGLTLAAMVAVHRWLRRRDAMVAAFSVALFAVSPYAVFLYAGYGESGLFCCAALFFLFVERRHYARAALSAGAATAFKQYGCLLGVVLAFVIALEYWNARERRWDWRRLWLLPLCFWGIALYMLYLWRRFGDPLAFIHAQKFWIPGGRPSGFSLERLITFASLRSALRESLWPESWFAVGLGIALTVLGTGLLVVFWKRLPRPMAIYLAFQLALLHLVGHNNSHFYLNLGRHFVLPFPFAALGATMIGYCSEKAGRNWVGWALFWAAAVISAFLMQRFTVEFYNGRWVS